MEVGKGQAGVLTSPMPCIAVRVRRKRCGAFRPSSECAFPRGAVWRALSEVTPCAWKVGGGKKMFIHSLIHLYFDGSVTSLNLIHVSQL